MSTTATSSGGYWITTAEGGEYVPYTSSGATMMPVPASPVPASPSADAYLLRALENRLGAMEKQIAALADSIETIKDVLLAILERDRQLTEQRECRQIAASPSEDLWDEHSAAS